MNNGELLDLFGQSQSMLLTTIGQLSDHDYRQQYHQDLSPPGWHLGHSVFTETYWIREVVMGQDPVSEELKSLYIPELSPKQGRSQALPPHGEMCDWARRMQSENRELLRMLNNGRGGHELMQGDYLIDFLLQHYAQHYETLMLIMTQRALCWGGREGYEYRVTAPLSAPAPAPTREMVTVSAGDQRIGSDRANSPYDNEQPPFSIQLDEFHIAATPVANGEYLAFMEAGGYTTRDYWSDAGWAWRTAAGAQQHPDHWRADAVGHWYGNNIDGPYELEPEQPLYGVNHYEATAFARWAGARLPHEYQWEAAARAGVLQGCGQVWEWCDNAFHPYTGFKAYPYAGYSSPYFDNGHYSLRGGSRLTQAPVKRHTVRNFYQADKRHIHAGIRLLFD